MIVVILVRLLLQCSNYNYTGRNRPMEQAPFPNRLAESALCRSVVRHMTDRLAYRLSDIVRLVTGNIPSSAVATYHLLLKHRRHYDWLLTASDDDDRTVGSVLTEFRHNAPPITNSNSFRHLSDNIDVSKSSVVTAAEEIVDVHIRIYVISCQILLLFVRMSKLLTQV